MSAPLLASRVPPRTGRGVDDRSSRRAALQVGATCWLVALAVFLLGVGRPAYWLDEFFTVDAATRSAADLARLVMVRDAPNGPYYVLMKPWVAVSTAEWWVRLPSVLAMAGAAGLLGGLVTRRAGVPAGLGAGLLLTALPAVSRHAQEARPYALALLALLVAAVAWDLLGVDRGRRGNTVAGALLAVAAAFAVLMNVMAAVVVVAQVLARVVDLRPGWRTRTRRTLVWAGAGALLASPQVLHLLFAGAIGVANPPPAGWASIAGAFADSLRPPWVLCVVLLLSVAGLGLLRDAAARPVVLLGASWALVVSAFLVVGALVDPSLAIGRYWLLATPGWTVLAGAGCAVVARGVSAAARRPRLAVPAALLPVAVVALLGAPSQAAMRAHDGHGQDVRPSLELLASPPYQEMDVVTVPVVHQTVATYAPELFERMPLARDPRPSGQLVVADVDAATASSRLSGTQELAVLGAGGAERVAAMVAGYPALRPFRVEETTSEGGWTVMHLRRP